MQLTFSYRETWLHRVNPGIKLIVSIALFAVVVLTHNLNVMIYLTAGALLPLLLFSGQPPKRLLLYASPFLLIFISSTTGMMMFGKGSTLWFHFGLIRITEESFYRGIHLGFRALQVSSVGLLFSLTTRPVDLFYSLMQQWRVSPKYAYSFLAALRMVPVVMEEFQTLRHALKVRGRKRKSVWTGWYTTLRMYAIPLLAQSIRRAHRTAVAMEAKRFSGLRQRTYYYQIRYSGVDLIYVSYHLLLLFISYYAGTLWPFLDAVDVR